MEENLELRCGLQCIGRLELETMKPLGFICGSLPVLTDEASSPSQFALVPTSETVAAPRYRMLPTETDLNNPPLVHEDRHGKNALSCHDLARKCEALAVSGIADYGDEIDVVAPADILKQIFKIPYSKSRLSVAVQRVGQTLILNTGPDVEETEKHAWRQTGRNKSHDQSIFVNFAMHSARSDAYEYCPSQCMQSQSKSMSSKVYPGQHEGKTDDSFLSSSPKNSSNQANKDEFHWSGNKQKGKNQRHGIVKRTDVRRKSTCHIKESEKYKSAGKDGFLRALFWQFYNFRMLLGSDLLLFSNEKYVAMSLHLWDVGNQVTPLTWLEAWLDNVMANVPELAICYHRNGVVQGYELLKTEDIFLLKGISDDGIPAFSPQIVQQNGLSILRFLQNNCKQNPGAYWLHKSAGEDVIQLFDLSILPKSKTTMNDDENCSPFSSFMNKARRNSLFSLGTLLYRLAHKLSLSTVSSNKEKCARLFRECLCFLNEQDHLVVRAHAHEQYARFILRCHEDMDLTCESVFIEPETTLTDLEDKTSEVFLTTIELHNQDISLSPLEENIYSPKVEASLSKSHRTVLSCSREDALDMCQVSESPPRIVRTFADSVASRLAAVHHISQAIRSLRWKRQLIDSQGELFGSEATSQCPLSMASYLSCACGDPDCIEACDLREWIGSSRTDYRLWKLVLLLGESYLELGQAYKDEDQLHEALKAVELACLIYGSVPQRVEKGHFIPSEPYDSSAQLNGDQKKVQNATVSLDSSTAEGWATAGELPSDLFWNKAWTLVGDIHVEGHRLNGKEAIRISRKEPLTNGLKISSDVVKEVKRLQKKLGQYIENCNSCSLISCSCQNDRASSGSSASSSVDVGLATSTRKCTKKSISRTSFSSPPKRDCEDYVSSEVLVEGSAASHQKQTSLCHSEHSFESHEHASAVSTEPEVPGTIALGMKNGGIFKFINEPAGKDVESNLSAAIFCYDAARDAARWPSVSSSRVESLVKKKGWVCNELGRHRLENQDLKGAEVAFKKAIHAFEEVSDHVNIILINCNLGHGWRSLAETMISKVELYKEDTFLRHAYIQCMDSAKVDYCTSLKYYAAANAELSAVISSVFEDLKQEVKTQFAHTYLRLGMLLARENISAAVYDDRDIKPCLTGKLKRQVKQEISASDAFRKALAMYNSLGDLRKQEAAYASFQLACYHRDCCLKCLNVEGKLVNLLRENKSTHKVKRYASLAELNWQKAADFYCPNTHPTMYLTILMERSMLLYKLSSWIHSNEMMESAFSALLEGRHVIEESCNFTDSSGSELKTEFMKQLCGLLKNMLSIAMSSATTMPTKTSPQERVKDISKLKDLYRMSLQSPSWGKLQVMYEMWMS